MAKKERKYRETTLRKIIRVQEITLQHTRKGVTQKWVFENLIKDQFYIQNERTYYQYLALNAKKLLKELYPKGET